MADMIDSSVKQGRTVTTRLSYPIVAGSKVRIRSLTPIDSATDNVGNTYTRVSPTEFRCASVAADFVVATCTFAAGVEVKFLGIDSVPPTLEFDDAWPWEKK